MPKMIRRLFLVCQTVLWLKAKSSALDQNRLKSVLLEGYRQDTRPVVNNTTPVNITLMLSLRQILDMRWTDELLTWEPSEYGGVESIHLYARSIWTPDILIYNEIHEKGYLNEMLVKRVRVFNTGLVHWPSPISVSTSCPLNMADFPWDEQRCYWQLGSWIYPLNEVDIHPQLDPDNFTVNYVKHGEWELVDQFSFRHMTNEGTGDWEDWPTVTFNVRLKRRPLFFLINLIMPSMIITILSLLAFFVPPEEGEKITVSITVLLASTVFLLVVNDTMPVQSYTIPIISKFYLATLGCLAMATIATVFVTYIHHKGSSGHLMSRRTSQVTNFLSKYLRVTSLGALGIKRKHTVDNELKGRNITNEWALLAKCLDRLFIVFFLTLFIVCLSLILV